MRIYEDIEIRNFQFWSGARDRIEVLTNDDWDIIESELEMEYPDGMSDGELNDLFWFDFDHIAEMLGYDSEEDMDKKRAEGYIDDDELVDYCADWFQSFLSGLYAKCQLQGDEQEGAQALMENISENLFGLELDEPDEDYPEPRWKQAYDYLVQQTDDQDIYDALFEDDRGEYETDGEIPSKEDFRELMMDQHGS
jgi:hypothetical protein